MYAILYTCIYTHPLSELTVHSIKLFEPRPSRHFKITITITRRPTPTQLGLRLRPYPPPTTPSRLQPYSPALCSSRSPPLSKQANFGLRPRMSALSFPPTEPIRIVKCSNESASSCERVFFRPKRIFTLVRI